MTMILRTHGFCALLLLPLLATGCGGGGGGSSSNPGASVTDSDGDGVVDAMDVCIQFANPDQLDADMDGIGDDCEVVDLVVGLSISGSSAIAVYYDVLNGAADRAPDFLIAGDAPRQLLIDDGVLYSGAFGKIEIWRDFANLTADQAPDVVLTTSSSPGGMLVEGGDLYVLDGQTTLLVYDDVDTLMTGDTPDATLDGFDTEEGGMDSAGGRLVLSNKGSGEVFVFNTAGSLTSGDGPMSADEVLSGGSITSPAKPFVADDVLYLSNTSSCCGEGGGMPDDAVLGFRPFSTLATGQSPFFELTGMASTLTSPDRLQTVRDRLFVANVNAANPLTAYDGLDSLVNDAPPSLFLNDFSFNVQDMDSHLDTLWMSARFFQGTTQSRVFGWRNASTIVTVNSPDFAFETPFFATAIAVSERR